VFRDDGERHEFTALLSQIDERFEVEVHVYCLMGNHFHLMVRSRTGRLSDAMQWILANYTRLANSRRGVDGAIFRGRFHSVPVASEIHRAVLVPYILANPVALGLSDCVSRYPWSSLGETIARAVGHSSKPWLRTDVVLADFGGSAEHLHEAVIRRAGEPDTSTTAPTAASSWREIVRVVEGSRGVSGRNESDSIVVSAAALLAVESFGVDRSELRHHLGVTDSGLRSILSRARKRDGKDQAFARLIQIARETLAASADASVPLGV
jgi:REP element-mobilizing transposase RayT